MTALDGLRRREQMEDVRRWSSRLTPILIVGLIMFWVGFWARGIDDRSSSEEGQQIVHALEDNADSLRLVRRVADSVRHVDSLARAAALAERAKTRAATAGITVSGDTVSIKRPAGGDKPAPKGATVVPADSVRTIVDPVLAGAFSQMKIQLVADSIALETSGAEALLLRHQVNLLERRDSLHVEREQELEGQRDRAFRRGVIAGVKGTVKVAVVVITLGKLAQTVLK